MMDSSQITSLLMSKYGSAEVVRDGVIKVIDKYRDKEYAVRYFDLSGNLKGASESLREYQESIMAGTFFAEGAAAYLRWNHYLYFVVGEDAYLKDGFSDYKCEIEADRTYARKLVLSEKELEGLLVKEEVGAPIPPVDIESQWTSRLDAIGIAYVLDDSISAPKAAQLVGQGHRQASIKEARQADLSQAERDAGSKFLKTIRIRGFREYPVKKEFEFGRVNLIYGRNGVGKTSLLEAIECLYCGENKRVSDAFSGTKIEGDFYGGSETLVTSVSVREFSSLRARNSKWYAKADLKKVTIADSFSKFNFLNTDAAVDLSNNNDSEQRLRDDVARLIFGAEAEKIVDRLSRVGEKIEESIRAAQKDSIDSKRRKVEAFSRLENLKRVPQGSDSVFADIQTILGRVGWKAIPATKKDASRLSEDVASVRAALTELSEISKFDILTSKEFLQKDSGSELEFLYSAERIVSEAKLLVRDRAEALHRLEMERDRFASIESLKKYMEVDFGLHINRRINIRSRIASLSSALASVEGVEDVLADFLGGHLTLSNALISAGLALEGLEISLKVEEESIRRLEARLSSGSIARQRLSAAVADVLALTELKDTCPVCYSEFEAGGLELRRASVAMDHYEDELRLSRSRLSMVGSDLSATRRVVVALRGLQAFLGEKAETSIDDAIWRVRSAREELDDQRLLLTEVQAVIDGAKRQGLDEEDLRVQLNQAALSAIPSPDEFSSIESIRKEAVISAMDEMKSIDERLSICRREISKLSGLQQSTEEFSFDVQLNTILKRCKEREAEASFWRKISQYIEIGDYKMHDVRAGLGQVVDLIYKLLALIESEEASNASIRSEESLLAKIDERISELSVIENRLQAASALIEDLLAKERDGVFAEQVVLANASSIRQIFCEIHAPNEFDIDVDGGALNVRRIANKQAVSLRQMSTGQRAAYALSLFLSMNRSLVSGPPVVLLDDPIAHVDDLNILSFLDHLRDLALSGSRQIFLATADDKLAGLFRQKFRFLGDEDFREISLARS